MYLLSQLWMLTPSMRRGEPSHLAHWSVGHYKTSFDQVKTFTQHSKYLERPYRRIDGPEHHLGYLFGEASDAAGSTCRLQVLALYRKVHDGPDSIACGKLHAVRIIRRGAG